VSVAMAITATKIVQVSHVSQDLRCLITKNAERVVLLIKHGLVLIIAAGATVAYSGLIKLKVALFVTLFVRSV
jgi:hypothetical protein